MRWHRHFALLLLAGTGSALLLAFPWLMLNLPVLGTGIALFFSQICHQDPTRSFVLAGTTLPVCARCLAFYLGGFAGIASYPVLGFRWRQGRQHQAASGCLFVPHRPRCWPRYGWDPGEYILLSFDHWSCFRRSLWLARIFCLATVKRVSLLVGVLDLTSYQHSLVEVTSSCLSRIRHDPSPIDSGI